MQTAKLDARLSAAAGFVRTDSAVICDVGTDHALLPCYLRALTKAEIIASDVNVLPLESARATMNSLGVSDITLKLSDGLDGVDYADDVIIAGMGGELIADIISRCRFLHKGLRVIVQPMTKHEAARRGLYAAGFVIKEEKTVVENGHCYTVICAEYSGNAVKIDDWFAYIGMNTDRVYIENQLKKLAKMSRGDAALTEVIEKIKEERL